MITRISLILLGLAIAAPTLSGQTVDERRRVTVNASAEVQREPERANVVLAVESEAEAAQEASQANARAMEQVVAALRNAGIDSRSIRTLSYQLNPIYVPPQRGESGQRISGYRAMNMVQVTVDSLPLLGRVIDAAIAAGANRVASLALTLRDTEEARMEAIRTAVERARREAEIVAEAAGQRLGPPLDIQTSANVPYPRPMFDRAVMAAEAMQAQTPIEGGTITVTANVTIVYQLEAR